MALNHLEQESGRSPMFRGVRAYKPGYYPGNRQNPFAETYPADKGGYLHVHDYRVEEGEPVPAAETKTYYIGNEVLLPDDRTGVVRGVKQSEGADKDGWHSTLYRLEVESRGKQP